MEQTNISIKHGKKLLFLIMVMLSENDFLFDYITKKECLVLKFLEEFLFLKSVSIIINYAIFF